MAAKQLPGQWRSKLLVTNSGRRMWFAAQDGGDFLRTVAGEIRRFRTESGALAAIAKAQEGGEA